MAKKKSTTGFSLQNRVRKFAKGGVTKKETKKGGTTPEGAVVRFHYGNHRIPFEDMSIISTALKKSADADGNLNPGVKRFSQAYLEKLKRLSNELNVKITASGNLGKFSGFITFDPSGEWVSQDNDSNYKTSSFSFKSKSKFIDSYLEEDSKTFPKKIYVDVDRSNNPNGEYELSVSSGDENLGVYYYDKKKDAEKDVDQLDMDFDIQWN